jgi:hypothetical protein
MSDIVMEVKLQEMFAVKQTAFGEIKKPLNQDTVLVKNRDGVFQSVGYYSHTAKKFLPLAFWPNELSPFVVAEIEKIKKTQVSAVPAPQVLAETVEEDEEDE